MIYVSIKCSTPEERIELRDKLCYALSGSPAYINSEIVVGEELYDEDGNIVESKDNEVYLLIGNGNDYNMSMTIDSSNLKVDKLNSLVIPQ